MTKQKIFSHIENNIIECDISYRGGLLKVDVSDLFPDAPEDMELVIGASQNYLGGGIAGSISGGAMFNPSELKTKKDRKLFEKTVEAVKEYFYNLNNGGGDDYMQENVTGHKAGGYRALQGLPRSGY